jgi:hypothetical protein
MTCMRNGCAWFETTVSGLRWCLNLTLGNQCNVLYGRFWRSLHNLHQATQYNLHRLITAWSPRITFYNLWRHRNILDLQPEPTMPRSMYVTQSIHNGRTRHINPAVLMIVTCFESKGCSYFVAPTTVNAPS